MSDPTPQVPNSFEEPVMVCVGVDGPVTSGKNNPPPGPDFTGVSIHRYSPYSLPSPPSSPSFLSKGVVEKVSSKLR